MRYVSTKIIPMGSTAFRQWRADSHCKLIHGYRLQCKLWFTADELDHKNWIYDFGGCREIKKLLEKQFDHTTVVAADDPELDTFKLMSDKGMIDLRIAEKGVGIERTAEWVFETTNKFVTEQTNSRVRVIKVEVWEHEGNSAIYEEYKDVINKTYDDVSVDRGDVPDVVDVVIGNNITTVPSEKTAVSNQPVEDSGPRCAPLHNKVTSGLGNLFEGTSWG
jgi:6-pyruvoyltetrahydropterin/6-carboxytetrahydropterin synthase